MIGSYTLNDLQSKKEIEFCSHIEDEELENIQYINDNAIVQIDNIRENQEDYINDLNRIIKIYNRLNKNFILQFDVEQRKDLYNIIPLLKKCRGKNIKIKCEQTEYTIDEYITEDEKLEAIVKNIKESNMSPLEKYFAVYNIVKKYKPYKENYEDLDQARKIKYILDNEYIVCVGYSSLLVELLNKVGIEACTYKTTTSKYDDETNINEKEKHFRTIVNIKDDKYNVDGYFIADATWDNHKNVGDTYDYALRPFNSMQKSEELFSLELIDYILDNSDFNSFCLKINIILNKKIKYGSYLLSAYESIFNEIICILKGIDTLEYKKLMKYVNTDEFSRTEKFYERFLTEVGHYIVSKSNKEISPNVIAKAATISKFYNEDIPESFKRTYENKIVNEYADYTYDIQNGKLIENDSLDTNKSRRRI